MDAHVDLLCAGFAEKSDHTQGMVTYRAAICDAILSTLDEDKILQLATSLLHRGFIRPAMLPGTNVPGVQINDKAFDLCGLKREVAEALQGIYPASGVGEYGVNALQLLQSQQQMRECQRPKPPASDTGFCATGLDGRRCVSLGVPVTERKVVTLADTIFETPQKQVPRAPPGVWQGPNASLKHGGKSAEEAAAAAETQLRQRSFPVKVESAGAMTSVDSKLQALQEPWKVTPRSVGQVARALQGCDKTAAVPAAAPQARQTSRPTADELTGSVASADTRIETPHESARAARPGVSPRSTAPQPGVSTSAEVASQSHEPQEIGALSMGEAPHAVAAAEAASSEQDESTATTLILRNLPASFDQVCARQWIDEKGYLTTYDFFLWFPATNMSRLTRCSYAFINFLTSEHAQKFRKEMHLHKISDPKAADGVQPVPLRIAVAKVQGFLNNYLRYRHFLEKSSTARCAPYFAKEAIEALTPEQRGEDREASSLSCASVPSVAPAPSVPHLKGSTTLILRNLPFAEPSQQYACAFLDCAGYSGLYDFLVFVPAKRAHRDGDPAKSAHHGTSYCFVNFISAEVAMDCCERLKYLCPPHAGFEFSILVSKVQGKKACIEHFAGLAESGRCTPWIRPIAVMQ